MSKQKKGFGRAGLSGLATTTLVIGACAAFAAPANAAGSLTAGSTPNILQGVNGQSAGDLTYQFPNAFTTGSTITFALPAQDCSTSGNIAKAIDFSATPTVSLTRDSATDTERVPTYTTTLSTNPADTGNCATVGVKDLVTVTLTQPSDTVGVQKLDLKLSGVKYDVGSDAPLGDVNVSATPSAGIAGAAAGTAANATVINKSYMVMPRMAALPGSSNNALGTITYHESSKGAYFGTGVNTVTLTLDNGAKFTPGVKPTIGVPAGYTVTATPTTDPAASSYAFTITGPATLSAIDVTVSGLRANAAGVGTASIASTVAQTAPFPAANPTGTSSDTAKALNVVAQDRIGGSDRYDTAAAAFAEFTKAFGTPNSVVVSGGELFPDALSANYLAGKLGTATLLTRANSLPQVTKNAIQTSGVATVYITGQTTAVSQGVADEIAALHVGGVAGNANITVIRVGGADRYATNADANRQNLQNATSGTAILAAGTAPYDSLAAGPVAYAAGYPLVLTDGSTLNHGEEGQFADLNVKNVVIVGGESVVSKAVADQLTKDGYNVIRISGPTRFATAAAIATWATTGTDSNGDGSVTAADGVLYTQAAGTLNASTTDIANGLEFPDALSDGPVAGAEHHPLLLSDGATKVGGDLAAYLGKKTVGSAAGQIGKLRAIGLNAATANSMIDQAAADIDASK